MKLTRINGLARTLASLSLAALFTSTAHAQLTLNSVDRGRYSEFGTHVFADYDSYLAGQVATIEFRNFLVFDTTSPDRTCLRRLPPPVFAAGQLL